MTTGPGLYGAKVQSWHKANPRDLLKRLLDEHRADAISFDQTLKKKVLAAFRDAVREDEDYLDPIIEYWFSNNYHSLIEAPREVTTPAQRSQMRQSVVETVKKAVERRIVEEAKIALLDMVLPNGKSLRDCTGKECAALGPKIGGWLTRVAGEIGPRQKVGSALTEDRLQALYGESK